MNQAMVRPSVAILTPHAMYYGGVEHVNRMLIEMLEEEGFVARILSQELLGEGLLVQVKKRCFGLNRLMAGYFGRHHSKDIDVVICNGEFSLGVRHPAAINSFHGCYFGYANAMRPFISEQRYRGLIQLADQQKIGAEGKYVVAVSLSVAEILKKQGVRVDTVINNAVDVDIFHPIPGLSRNDRCLYVGSSDYYGKGLDILEKLSARGIRIDCVTSMRPRDKGIGWLGNIPNAELPRIYASYKVLLLPSRFEGCPLVPLEAMACGTPIIMSSVGSGPDIIREIPEFVTEGSWEDMPGKIAERMSIIERNYGRFAERGREYVLKHHCRSEWKRKWLRVIDVVFHRAVRQ